MNLVFEEPRMLGWLAAAGVAAAAAVAGIKAEMRADRILGGAGGPTRSTFRRAVRHGGLVAALVLIAVALARPGWRTRAQSAASGGRDVVFVLDVSRSMLARDDEPDRLSAARLAAEDLLGHLRPDDRAGLVVFAGRPVIVSPLATDREFLRQALEEAGPQSVAYGGTGIAAALRLAADALLNGPDRRGEQDLILLSDGGDTAGSAAQAAAAVNAAQAGLIVIGLGSDSEGARIPVGDRFLVYQGQEVWTRQESALLESLARACRAGLYLNAGTDPVDLTEVYERFSHWEAARGAARQVSGGREEEFPWLLGAAMAVLIAGAIPWTKLRLPAAIAAAALVPPASAQNLAAPGVDALHSNSGGQAAPASELGAAPAGASAVALARQLYNAATCWLLAGRETERESEAVARLVGGNAAAMPKGYAVIGAELPTESAAALFEKSARGFEAALRIEPEFPEAARNLEIARACWAEARASEKAQAGQSPRLRQMDEGPPKSGVLRPQDEGASQLSPEDILRQEKQDDARRSPPNPVGREPVAKDW